MCSSGLCTSTPAGGAMSAAVTSPGPCWRRYMTTDLGELHLELALSVQGGDVQLGVVHLDARGRRDVGRGHLAWTLLAQVHDDRLVVLGGHHQFLQVQDD